MGASLEEWLDGTCGCYGAGKVRDPGPQTHQDASQSKDQHSG